jgi:hypothetical protein
MKKIAVMIGVIVIIAIIVVVAIRFSSGPEDGWICESGQWVKHGKPSAPMPSVPCAGQSAQELIEPKRIGGDKDAHGCYLSAGYRWCEAKQKCLREWEEKCEENGASSVTVEKSPDSLRVSLPTVNSVIKSPLVISGEASGWYFEAVFPVRVTDEKGNTLGTGQAQAQGDWMTSAFVPFAGTITFDPKGYQSGFVVFEKDNPSGQPQNALSYSIPVRFSGN